MLKLKMMLCDGIAGRGRCTSKRVCQSMREATTTSGVDVAPRLAGTTLNGIISPSEG